MTLSENPQPSPQSLIFFIVFIGNTLIYSNVFSHVFMFIIILLQYRFLELSWGFSELLGGVFLFTEFFIVTFSYFSLLDAIFRSEKNIYFIH